MHVNIFFNSCRKACPEADGQDRSCLPSREHQVAEDQQGAQDPGGSEGQVPAQGTSFYSLDDADSSKGQISRLIILCQLNGSGFVFSGLNFAFLSGRYFSGMFSITLQES